MAAGRGARFGAERPSSTCPSSAARCCATRRRRCCRDGAGRPHPRRSAPPARRGASRRCSTGCLPCRRSRAARPGRRACGRGWRRWRRASPPDVVLVHDAARPVVPPGTVAAAASRRWRRRPARSRPSAVTDTLKRGEAGRILGHRAARGPVPRPDAAGLPVSRAAGRASGRGGRGDGRCAAAGGWRAQAVALVEGSESNVKITFPEDLGRVAASLSAGLLPRIGTGFDVHRIAAGRPMVLCGVARALRVRAGRAFGRRCRHPRLCDAIYGALAEGDIGRLLPAERDALEGRRQRRSSCATPPGGSRRAAGCWPMPTSPCSASGRRIGPHREAMQARLAELLGVEPVARRREGHHDRTAGLHRPRRGDRGAGGGDAAAAAGVALALLQRQAATDERCCSM